MKILIVPDVPNWAIGKLAKAKQKYIPYHDIRIEYVHPKDVNADVAQNFKKLVDEFNPDIIHWEYYRSASQLIELLPELKERKMILTHHNQRDKALFSADWNELGIDRIICHTKKCKELLNEKGFKNVSVINHGIDLNYFTYSSEEPKEPKFGYVGRVVRWKGLKEISEVSKKLGYPVLMMGKVDDGDYWNEVDKENLRFDFLDVADKERIGAYRNMTIYVGNSKDGYEEGTLPFLEAMACGVPVVTTPSGVAADIITDGENGLLVNFEDTEMLEMKMKMLMEDKDLRNKLRKNAWNTVKNMTEEKMAYEYSTVYNQLYHETDNIVSVIIPYTESRISDVKEVLDALKESDYKMFEVVLACDEVIKERRTPERLNVEDFRDNLKGKYPFTIKHVTTEREGYNLAMARNLAAIEAEGKFLMFIDSRLRPSHDAMSSMVSKLTFMDDGSRKIWLFGDKGSGKRNFVENFSMVLRKHFMRFGMMNERIDRYGGMSQDIRTRWIGQGNEFVFCEDACAEEISSSKMTLERRKDIIDTKFKLFKMHQYESH